MTCLDAKSIHALVLKAGWPRNKSIEATAMALYISGGDDAFKYVMSNGLELLGLFGITVEQAQVSNMGYMWGAFTNVKGALTLYKATHGWGEFWLAPPVSRLAATIAQVRQAVRLDMPTLPIPKPRPLDHRLQQLRLWKEG